MLRAVAAVDRHAGLVLAEAAREKSPSSSRPITARWKNGAIRTAAWTRDTRTAPCLSFFCIPTEPDAEIPGRTDGYRADDSRFAGPARPRVHDGRVADRGKTRLLTSRFAPAFDHSRRLGPFRHGRRQSDRARRNADHGPDLARIPFGAACRLRPGRRASRRNRGQLRGGHLHIGAGRRIYSDRRISISRSPGRIFTRNDVFSPRHGPGRENDRALHPHGNCSHFQFARLDRPLVA